MLSSAGVIAPTGVHDTCGSSVFIDALYVVNTGSEASLQSAQGYE